MAYIIKTLSLSLKHLISYIVSLLLPVYTHPADYIIISNLYGFSLWAKLSRSSAMHQLRLYFVHAVGIDADVEAEVRRGK